MSSEERKPDALHTLSAGIVGVGDALGAVNVTTS